MTARKTWRPLWGALAITLVAFLFLGAQAQAEQRLPANRIYLGFVQGLEDQGPFEGSFACLMFTPDGRFVAGDDSGIWFINDKLRVAEQRAIIIRLTVENDEGPPEELDVEALCWLNHNGPRNSLACSGHAEGDGLAVNFALTGRPLGGGTSIETRGRCQTMAEIMNARLEN